MCFETSIILKTLEISGNYFMVGALKVYMATTMLSMYYKHWLETLDIPYHFCNDVPFPDSNATIFTVFQMPNAVSYRNTFYCISTVSLHDLSLLLVA